MSKWASKLLYRSYLTTASWAVGLRRAGLSATDGCRVVPARVSWECNESGTGSRSVSESASRTAVYRDAIVGLHFDFLLFYSSAKKKEEKAEKGLSSRSKFGLRARRDGARKRPR